MNALRSSPNDDDDVQTQPISLGTKRYRTQPPKFHSLGSQIDPPSDPRSDPLQPLRNITLFRHIRLDLMEILVIARIEESTFDEQIETAGFEDSGDFGDEGVKVSDLSGADDQSVGPPSNK